ncbi:MAG: response regulator [Clostridiaceae bacterium]
MRILIVDDDLLITEVIRDSINWRVLAIDDIDIAHTVAGAKKLFEEKIPDIVLCDIEMPQASGIDLLKWIRGNSYKCEFIFLTCHENFEFASTALEYNAISYITKPFNIDKTEMAISKAVEKIRKESYLEQYSQYGRYWINNKRIMAESFWRELLFSSISDNEDLVIEEISKRNLQLDINEDFFLVLVSVIKGVNEDISVDYQVFEYGVKKLSSETILGDLHLDNTIYYVDERKHYAAVIVPGNESVINVKERCRDFIYNCDKYLKCRAACYISNKVKMTSLAESRIALEEMDENNIVFRSKVFIYGEDDFLNSNEHYAVNADILVEMLEKGEKLKIINYMKEEMELLAARGNLDATVIYSIHQDFMQILYAFLYKNEIQAHKLFSDKVCQKLNSSATKSMFDMLKWIHFITTKTIDFIEEVKKSHTIIDKAKEYIHEHYKEDITKKDVAASVFLTPDYMAKIFKSKTGIAVKEYVNYYRIEKAKELLRNNNISISMVAAEVGFDNFSYFSTLFKKVTGTSPGSYRKEDEY